MPNHESRGSGLDLDRPAEELTNTAKALLLYTRVANDLLSINEAASALAMGSSSKEKQEEMTARLTTLANKLSALLEELLGSEEIDFT